MTRAVAVLGAGIGAEHIDGYLALPGRYRVVHVCDLDPTRAAAQAARCGATVSAEIDGVLADPAVELVDICLPPRLHGPVARAALAAGKHVIVEKPLAGSLLDARQLAGIARDRGRQVFPVFQYRYGQAFAVLDALVAAGLTGRPEVASLETHWNRDSAYYSVPWRGKWSHELGGAVLSHAIHAHDLLSRYFGRVEEVSAMLDTRINGIETEDCAAIALRTSGGGLATSSITLGAADDTSRLRFVFQNLTAESGCLPYTPGQGNWRFTARAPADQAAIDQIITDAPAVLEGFAGFLAAVADGLDGAGTAVTLEDGIAAVELATAIYHADRTGARVSLPLDATIPVCQGLAP
ncbi:MAG: Gfo/Idh/MocA family oxidoreductase [Rhodobacteraceae bacterium]|nr:Gfo/Idh/MocA family oxidoreductase [Paracoccaceae bacterium]